jgi:hypothetical protein
MEPPKTCCPAYENHFESRKMETTPNQDNNALKPSHAGVMNYTLLPRPRNDAGSHRLSQSVTQQQLSSTITVSPANSRAQCHNISVRSHFIESRDNNKGDCLSLWLHNATCKLCSRRFCSIMRAISIWIGTGMKRR